MRKKWLMGCRQHDIKFKFFLLLMMFLVGCTGEDDVFNWEIIIENRSDHDINLSVYHDSNEFNYENFETSILIRSGEVKTICNGGSEFFGELQICFQEPSQYIFSFPNGRGHYCTSSILEDQSICFVDGDFIFDRDKRKVSKKTLVTYTILQEDYENAHVLPE